MTQLRSFPAICRPDARILILGSMPGRESLAQGRYYAHARNSFWPIVTDLLGISATDYAGRSEQLTYHGIALWDVLKACVRSGSLDADIIDDTIVINDFNTFYKGHPGVRRVYFNGAKAESVYRQHVLPQLLGEPVNIPRQRLPSTSPAHAAMSFDEKREAWKAILDN